METDKQVVYLNFRKGVSQAEIRSYASVYGRKILYVEHYLPLADNPDLRAVRLGKTMGNFCGR